jgi:hypothetical protein
MNGALTLVDSSAGRARLLRSFLLAAPQQLDHLGDSPRALLRMALGGVDPTQIAAPVELRQAVEERTSLGIGVERNAHVVGEVVPLRTFRGEYDLDRIAR